MGVPHKRVSCGRAPRGRELTRVHLIGVHLTGMHLIGVHLTGMHLIGVCFIRVYVRRVLGAKWHLGPITPGRRTIDKHPNI